MKTILSLWLCSLTVAFGWTPTDRSFDTNVFLPIGYVFYLKTNAIAAMAGGVSGGLGTTNGASTNVGAFLKTTATTQYWSFNGVGLTNLSIPLASVTNAGTAGYSNAGAFVLSKDGSATNLTIRSNVVIHISSLESNSIIGPTGVGITYLFRSGLVRLTNSVTLDWIDFNDGLKIGSQSSANSATISLDALTGLPKFTGLTASRATVTGSDGYLASSATTGTQVGYLSDVTGLIQAQIDGKTTSSDTAFDSSWNGVTTIAPSKNSVYDWAHTFDTDDDGKVNVLDQGVGITITDSSGILQTPITDSAGLAAALSDETGSAGGFVRATSPTLVTPILGVAAATTINKVTLTTPATGSTLTIADGKTATISKTMTFTSAGDSGVLTFPNATATIPATSDKLSVFAATTSAELAGVLSDESGDAGVFLRASLSSLTSGDYLSWNGSTWVNIPAPAVGGNFSTNASTAAAKFYSTVTIGTDTILSDGALSILGQNRLTGNSTDTFIRDPNGNATFQSTSTGVIFLKAGNQTVISANSSLLFMDTVPVQGGASTWTTLGASGQITGTGASNYLSGQLRADGVVGFTNSLVVGTNGPSAPTNNLTVASTDNSKSFEVNKTVGKIFANVPMTFQAVVTNNNIGPTKIVGTDGGGREIGVTLSGLTFNGTTLTASGGTSVTNCFVVMTNAVLNNVNTNTSGAIQQVCGLAWNHVAAVNGRSALELMVDQAGGTTFSRLNGAQVDTTVAVTIAMDYTNGFCAYLSNGASWYLTNSSAGVGNDAGIVAGTFQDATIGGSGTVTSVGASGPAGFTWSAAVTGSGTLMATTPGVVVTNGTSIAIEHSNHLSVDFAHQFNGNGAGLTNILRRGTLGTVNVGAGALTSGTAAYTAGAPLTNDSRMQITVVTGSSGSAGDLCLFSNVFSTAYSVAPVVVAIPRNQVAAQYTYFNTYCWLSNVTTTGFAWYMTTAPASKTMTWEFLVLQ